MRILLANHHLHERAGSELYTIELAEMLQDAGHDVAVFTFFRGDISEERLTPRDIPVFSVADGPGITSFSPDVLHVHHAPCLYFLGALELSAVAVFSSLGVVPPLEGAPVVWNGVVRGLAVSEEVKDAVASTPFGRAVPVEIFRNWFDDRQLTRSRLDPRRPARRWVVVSNHLDPTLAGHLDEIRARRADFEWVHFGAPHASVRLDARALEGFDGVITIGRTALLAGALGKPCLLYDVHGCDGFLAADRLEALATRNFSGRLEKRRPSREELESLLLDAASQLDLEATREALWSAHRLSGRAEDLEKLYADALAGHERLDGIARQAYGRAGAVHAGVMQDALYWRHRAGELERTQRSAARRTASLEAEVLRLQRRLGDLEESLSSVDQSAAWRMVRGVRRVKDQLIPHGSSARSMYDRGLTVLKTRFRTR